VGSKATGKARLSKACFRSGRGTIGVQKVVAEQDFADLTPDEEFELSGDLISDPKELKSVSRRRRSAYNEDSIHPADLEEKLEQGWEKVRAGKRTIRIRRPKPHHQMLEDRAWNFLYQMGYTELSSDRLVIRFQRASGSAGSKQIDAFACDDETAILIECKSKTERGRRSLQKDLSETAALQDYLRKAVFRHYRDRAKPKLIWLYVTSNIIWSESDIDRARDANIYIVTENELNYFEAFLRHMGPAGRYQILGEFLKGQKIPAMSGMRVPAIRGKLGDHKFYTFVTTARNLLRIAFVNHQALNHPDGRPAYQRMVSSSRIKEIGTYISEKNGFFPTNLLINFVDSPRFDLISNKENTDASIKFGWLTLPSVYRSAWIIDGQHRLYGYSGLDDKFLDHSLLVLAFDRMDTYKEADLFITINHKQKSVPKGLLVALLADLRMGDADPKTALSALASAVVRKVNQDKTSPLWQRFAMPDVPATTSQNLTISECVNGLNRSGLLGKVVHGQIAPSVFSDETDELTVERARQILNGYFEHLRAANPKRWEAGRQAFVCVNPGIRAHLMLIPEIISYLSHRKGVDFLTASPGEVVDHIVEIAQPMFQFFKSATDEEIKDLYSRKFGEGGVKEYLYNLCETISAASPDFGSEEFKRYLAQKESDVVDEANRFVMGFSERLMDCVIGILKSRYGEARTDSGEPAYWEYGVTGRRVLENSYKKQLADSADRRKPKEAYLDIIDLKEIVETKENWLFFESSFNIALPGEKRGSKKYHTAWIAKFSEIRNIAAHKNALRTYTDDDLEFIDWLRSEVAPRIEQELAAL
jgi:DGQHR domain-containing protein